MVRLEQEWNRWKFGENRSTGPLSLWGRVVSMLALLYYFCVRFCSSLFATRHDQLGVAREGTPAVRVAQATDEPAGSLWSGKEGKARTAGDARRRCFALLFFACRELLSCFLRAPPRRSLLALLRCGAVGLPLPGKIPPNLADGARGLGGES